MLRFHEEEDNTGYINASGTHPNPGETTWEIPASYEYLDVPNEDAEDGEESIEQFSVQPKYTMLEESRSVTINGETDIQVFRISATRDFGNVREGELGGWIQDEKNLSHEGTCWVYDNAVVADNAAVYRDAMVANDAFVSGDAVITDNAKVLDHSVVRGASVVEGHAVLRDSALVTDNASATDYSRVEGQAVLSGYTRIAGHAMATGFAIATGAPWLTGHTLVCDDAFVDTEGTLDGYSQLRANQSFLNGFNKALLCALADLKVAHNDYKTCFRFWEKEFEWKVREGKAFKFESVPMAASAHISIVHVPYWETQQEGFDPKELFLRKLEEEEPDEPETSEPDAAEPIEGEQEESAEVEETPEEVIEYPIPEEPDREIHSIEDEFAIKQPEVFYILVEYGELNRLYSVTLKPIPYGLDIMVYYPDSEDFLPVLNASDTLDDSLLSNRIIEAYYMTREEGYLFKLTALTKCKMNVYVRVQEDLLYDRRSPKPEVPREAWVLVKSDQFKTDDMAEFTIPVDLYKEGIVDEETGEPVSTFVIAVSIACSTTDDKNLVYEYRITDPQHRYKDKWDLELPDLIINDEFEDERVFWLDPDPNYLKPDIGDSKPDIEDYESSNVRFSIAAVATRDCIVQVYVGDTLIEEVLLNEGDRYTRAIDPSIYGKDGKVPDVIELVSSVEVEDAPDQVYFFQLNSIATEEPEVKDPETEGDADVNN